VQGLRADARSRIILYYQTQVSLQETGSEPLAWTQFLCQKNLLASLAAKEKIGTLLPGLWSLEGVLSPLSR